MTDLADNKYVIGFLIKTENKGEAMKLVKILLIIFVAAGLIVGCQSAKEKAYHSEKEVNEERLELIEQYKDCMEKADKDKEKESECEQYLKAADALK